MKRIVILMMVVATLAFSFVGCGVNRSGSSIEILNVELFGNGKPQIRIVDPNDGGVRVLHIGDKVNGMQVLEADKDGVTFLGLDGQRIYISTD